MKHHMVTKHLSLAGLKSESYYVSYGSEAPVVKGK